MEIIKSLINRFWKTGILFLLGFLAIIYIGFGILYLQQGPKQKDLNEQVTKISIVVAKPLPGAAKLQAEYDEVNRSLSPLTVPEVLEIIVGIAKESGINVALGSDKFYIPPPGGPAEQKIGEVSYQVLSLSSIRAQGDYDDIMAFISALDSGETMKNMVLKKVDMSQVEIRYSGEEVTRRAEFRDVSSAVIALMVANGLTEIPDPKNYDGGVATNYIGDDSDTGEVTEGFPDTTTTAAEKGYTGTGTPKDGYVLYQHDIIISTDNTTEFETVDYIDMLTTQYYYTCEADGTVRQFDGPDVVTAIEYLGSEEVGTEILAILNVDLYTKPLESSEEASEGG